MSVGSEIDLDALASKIAARLSPEALLDAQGVGDLLGFTAKYVREELVSAPGFPKPIRLAGPGGRKGQPRWMRADIAAYITKHKDGVTATGGRPRKKVDWS